MSDDIIQVIVDPPLDVSVTINPPVNVDVTTAGANGLSAYEIAVVNGFVGTEAEWLVSLVGGISLRADNQLVAESDGIYVPPPQLASAQW